MMLYLLCSSRLLVFPGLLVLFSIFGIFTVNNARAGLVEIKKDQLWIDGQAQPQLFGAELQYFRLRGGNERNIPRHKVIALWNQALDRMVEAKMNAISFYIPWDFHEYAEGKFDFTGTADDDGDGRADYPSRDIFTFFRLIQEHGIKHIMARPGPYINAEWGYLGFGAIPLWFHEKYPNSHALNSKGQKTTLFSYSDPDFLRHSKIWIETVYHKVLRHYVGPGRPISFVQIDNETNLMWQSIYNHDYSPRNISKYKKFLKEKYKTIARLNSLHGRSWSDWNELVPPAQPRQNPAQSVQNKSVQNRNVQKNSAEDQDWYIFQDYSLYTYLKKIRQTWSNLGLKEPTVLFTLAESYNATENGLLPHYKWRNSPNTGMMTVNLYPKYYETPDQTLMNQPFKADHDVKAADAASDFYLGRREEWVLGPEIQGGWWKGIHVSEASRRQTYLTTIGHGLKALFIYYFNEGNNWQHDWMKQAIAPFYKKLKKGSRYKAIEDKDLPDEFWNTLDDVVANKFMVVRTRSIWINGGTHPDTLYFDAPLGPDAKPREPYRLIKDIGQKIINPYGDFLAKAQALEDPVCIIKNSDEHSPSEIPGINTRIVHSEWNAGLLALLMHAGVNARIHHWKLNPKADLLDHNKCKLIIYQDVGLSSVELIDTLTQAIDHGGAVLSFIHTGLAEAIKTRRTYGLCQPLPPAPMDAITQRCTFTSANGTGTLYQAKVPIYDVFNTDFYHLIHDANERRGFIENILRENKITPHIKIKGGGDRTVTFARANSEQNEIWVTVKTAKRDGFKGRIQWGNANQNKTYTVTDVLNEETVEISGIKLFTEGFDVVLGESGSKAYFIKPKVTALKDTLRDTLKDSWLESQKQISTKQMLQNISPEGTVPGTVIASPSRQWPDYWYHWVRDASLVMDVVIDLLSQSHSYSPYINSHIRDFILLSRRQQLEPSAEGLGEPRFLVNGSADTTQWARPQHDGPALRAMTLIRFLNLYLKNNLTQQEADLKTEALDVIRADLEFVINNWNKPCYDLWEELRGIHFYTQAVQYSSLRKAAIYFKHEGDRQFSSRLAQEATKIEAALEKYWDEKKGYILASLSREERSGSPNYKDENLDTSVVLAALHSNINQGILSLADDRVLSTAHALEQAFAKEYAINNPIVKGEQAPAIGRFTDDVYFGGNPWYMTTAAFAELYFRLGQTILKKGHITITKNNIEFFHRVIDKSTALKLSVGRKISSTSDLGQKLLSGLRQKGDSFLSVIQKYTGSQGRMSEQFDRDAGVPVSAYDLTWSYASFLSAVQARARFKLPN